MIKFVLAAVWIAVATLASVYFSFGSTKAQVAERQEPTLLGGLDYVSTDIISVPLMRKGDVYGYFLARFVYTVEPAKLQKLVLPAQVVIMDQVYSYLYANPQIDFANRAELDLDMLRMGIRDSINGRIGEKLVHDVMIEQIDFLSKQDIRDQTMRRRITAVNNANRRDASAAEQGSAGH